MECEDIELIKLRGELCECNSGYRRGNCCYSTNAEGKRIDELIFPYYLSLFKVDFRYMMYVQKLSNHIALMIPSTLPQEALLTSGNEDGPEKKAKDQEIIDIALPEQSRYLCTREPMLNYADAELCGKWKVCSASPPD